MLCSSLNPSQIGTVGEQLVRYKLMRWGFEAVMLEQGNPYDILVVDPLIRIQVKSTKRVDPNKPTSYRFNTRKGCSNTTYYQNGDADCFAFVTLDNELVYFTKPVLNKKCKRIASMHFSQEGEHQSWLDIISGM